MKKIISIFLAVSMLLTLSLGCIEVSAARVFKIKNEATEIVFATSEALPCTVTEVDGAFGRANGDKSIYAVRSVLTEGTQLKSSYVNTKVTNIDSSKDLIIETSFIPKDNVKDIQIRTDSSAYVGIDKIPASAFNVNQWNKLKIIVNSGSALVYINGVLYDTYTYTGLTKDVLRLIFNSDDSTYALPIGVYMDNFYVYQEASGVESGVEAMPFNTASGNDFTADLTANTIKFSKSVSVSELKTKLGIAESVSLRVYADDKYSTALDNAAKVSNGNVMVLQTAENLFQYITIEVDNGLESIYTNDGSDSNVGGSASSIVSGFAGKETSDSVVNYSRASKNAFFMMPTDKSIDTDKVLVADMQFYIGDTVNSFTLGSTSNAAITTAFNKIDCSDFNNGIWNNLKVVIDFSNNDASLYLNNNKIASDTAITFNNKDGLRFIFAGTSPVEVYFDNINFYQSTKAFEVEDTGFTYPITVSTDAYVYDRENNEIDFGSYLTLADIKAKLNMADCSVRAFNTDFTTQFSDSQMVVGGSVLVIEKNTGEIQYINVAINEPVDKPAQLYYNNGSSTTYGTSSELVTGVKGRNADDSSVKIAKSASTGLIWYGTPKNSPLSITDTAKDLVYECSFVPPEGMKYLNLAHSSNSDLGTGNIPASSFISDAWNKIKLVFNLSTKKGEVFINGNLYAAEVDMVDLIPTELRTVFTLDGSVDDTYAYVDDINVYINDVGFESDEEYRYLISNNNEDYIVDNNTMKYIGKETLAGQIKTKFATDGVNIRIYSENYGELLTDSDELSTGDRIVFVTADNIFTTYTFEKMIENKIYLSGEGYCNSTQYTDKNIDVTVLTNGTAVLVVSYFNEKNQLVKLKTANPGQDGVIKYSFTPTDVKSTIKFMVLDSLATAKPLAEKVELEYRQSMSVLIVGNSFSTDSLKYLREIAEADGVEINVGRLIKGGSDFTHHYNTRETTENVNVLHYNGISTGYTNLKTVLEDYDWDYVAVQNWSNKAPALQSDSEWSTVGENLIAYIHENEPSAEILINKTWSFEKGYGYVTDSDVQASADEYIATKTELVADNAAELIGVDKIRIVPAGDAFTAARNYADNNGVHIFDTTYYAEGHTFTADMNRQTIEVGQGILSPDEEDAGYIRLHRDGFHSSLIARYMLAAVWYECLTGKSIVGNTFVPKSDAIDSGAVVMDEAGSLVVFYKFDAPSKDRIKLIQDIVHKMMLENSDW